jgi:hypothetical protein
MKRSLILHRLALGTSFAFSEGYKVLAKHYSNAFPVAEMPSPKKWTI